MKYVLDASVVITRLLGEEHAEKARRLVEAARAGTDATIAPDFFPAECGHALFRAERRKLIAPGEARQLLLSIPPDMPQLHPTIALLRRAAGISGHLKIGFYDCVYMALAERETVQLVTVDTKLVRAAKADYPYVVYLADLS